MGTAIATRPKASKKITGKTAASQKTDLARKAANKLKAVSDGTRLQVVLELADGEKHVGALCAALGQSQPAVSHHLALMRHGGFIAPRRQGKNNFYALTETGRDLLKVVKILVGKD